MISLNLISQNQIYMGENLYKSTNNWTFYMDSFPGEIKISVGKKQEKGVVLLSVRTIDKTHKISGNLFIILENGNIIKCLDRNIKDYVNNESRILYNLTDRELENLKRFRIHSVRYFLKEGITKNRSSFEAINGSKFTEPIKTNLEILRLYN